MNLEKNGFVSKAKKIVTAGLASLILNTSEPAKAEVAIEPQMDAIETPGDSTMDLLSPPELVDRKKYLIERVKRIEDELESEIDISDMENAADWEKKTTIEKPGPKLEDLILRVGGRSIFLEYANPLDKASVLKGYREFRSENIDMCVNLQLFCEMLGISESEKKRVELTPEVYKLLNEINDYVNKTINQIPDKAGQDKWLFAVEKADGGDCEDLMILKVRKILEVAKIQKIDIDGESFSFSIVEHEFEKGKTQWHAVLIFHSLINGKPVDLVLDNIEKTIVLLTESKHKFLTATGPKGLQHVFVKIRSNSH